MIFRKSQARKNLGVKMISLLAQRSRSMAQLLGVWDGSIWSLRPARGFCRAQYDF
jgi:hypothetical protein